MAYLKDGKERSYIEELEDLMSGELHYGDTEMLQHHVNHLRNRIKSMRESIDEVEEKQITRSEMLDNVEHFMKKICFFESFVEWAERIINNEGLDTCS